MMKKIIFASLAVTTILLINMLVSSPNANSSYQKLSREFEVRGHGAGEIENEAEDLGGAEDINDDHRGRGRGRDDLARREDRREDRRADREVEQEVEAENEIETLG